MKFNLSTAYANNALAKREISQKTVFWLLLVFVILSIFLPEFAFAEPWDNAAQKVVDIFTGGLARLLAIIAIIACGIMALFGRLSWDWAIKIIVGIVLIFGSATIIDYLIAAAG